MVKIWFGLLKDVFWNRIWGILSLGWAIVGNILTVIQILEDWFNINGEIIKTQLIEMPIILFITENWWWMLIVAANLALCQGLINKAKPYLWDEIDVDIEFEMYPRPHDGYVSIKVHSKENEDIIEPALSYIQLERSELKFNSYLQQYNGGNADISRWLGGQEPVLRGKSHIVFNLAIQEGSSFTLLFDDGSKAGALPGLYRITVVLDGRIGKDKNKIKRQSKICYLEYWTEDLETIDKVDHSDKSIKVIREGIFLDIREESERPDEKLIPCGIIERRV